MRVTKVTIGNGAIGTIDESEEMTVLQVIATYPQLIGYDPAVYEYFQEQAHLCGWDLNLTYPQIGGHFPSIVINYTTGLLVPNNGTSLVPRSLASRSEARGKLGKLVNAAKAMEKRLHRIDSLPTFTCVTSKSKPSVSSIPSNSLGITLDTLSEKSGTDGERKRGRPMAKTTNASR